MANTGDLSKAPRGRNTRKEAQSKHVKDKRKRAESKVGRERKLCDHPTAATYVTTGGSQRQTSDLHTERTPDRSTDRDATAPVSRPDRVDQIVESKDGRRSRRFPLRDLVWSFLPDKTKKKKW